MGLPDRVHLSGMRPAEPSLGCSVTSCLIAFVNRTAIESYETHDWKFVEVTHFSSGSLAVKWFVVWRPIRRAVLTGGCSLVVCVATPNRQPFAGVSCQRPLTTVCYSPTADQTEPGLLNVGDLPQKPSAEQLVSFSCGTTKIDWATSVAGRIVRGGSL